MQGNGGGQPGMGCTEARNYTMTVLLCVDYMIFDFISNRHSLRTRSQPPPPPGFLSIPIINLKSRLAAWHLSPGSDF